MIDNETKQKLLKELEKCGNVFVSCSKVGINRSTFYRWKESDDIFRGEAEKVERLGRADNTDIGEHALMMNVKKGNMDAIKYLLRHNSPMYRRPMMPSIKEFENVYPGEGFSRFREAMLIKRIHESKQNKVITFKPNSDSEIKDTEIERYEKYLKKWYENTWKESYDNLPDYPDSRPEID